MTHPTITKAQAVKLARDAGFAMENSAAMQAAENLAKSVYKLGRNAGLEAAKAEAVHWQKVSDTNPNGDGNQHGALLASVIESLKDNTP